jgi:DeoR/GlpR family transcriptional regulator of sugar metabolism
MIIFLPCINHYFSRTEYNISEVMIIMLTEERKKQIIELIEKDGIVSMQQLVDVFNVSIFTIRRDISDLEDKGLIRKTHGGAAKVEKSMWLPTIEEGQKDAAAEKRAIAFRASNCIVNGDTVFLMGSTITHMVIPHILNRNITVVTNSLDVGKKLCQYDNIETIIIGGKIKNYKGNVLGSSAVEYIQNFYFDKALIPCAGIDSKGGVTTSTTDSADFTRAVINSTRESIFIADYRKIGRITFSKICDVSCMGRLITDTKADKRQLEEFNQLGIIIDVVDVNE